MVRQRHPALFAALVVALVVGCGDEQAAAPLPMVAAAPAPAPPPAPPSGITELPTYDPAAGHLDRPPPAAPAQRPRGRAARPIGLLLRSTPSGATVAIDGLAVGRTPVYWEGESTGGERELTFTLPGHGVARYRFVPITSGVVHGRLEPLAGAPGAPPRAKGAVGAAAAGAGAAADSVGTPSASAAPSPRSPTPALDSPPTPALDSPPAPVASPAAPAPGAPAPGAPAQGAPAQGAPAPLPAP